MNIYIRYSFKENRPESNELFQPKVFFLDKEQIIIPIISISTNG